MIKQRNRKIQNMISNLNAYGSTTIWIDIIWFTIVLVISPVLFLFTMAICELPVLLVHQMIQIIRRVKAESVRQ